MALRNALEGIATESGQGEIAQLVRVLRNLATALQPDPTNGVLRVNLFTSSATQTLNVNPGANTTHGGWNMQYDQPGQMMIHASANRNRITVS